MPRILFFLFVLCLAQKAWSQIEDPIFSQLTVDNGLPQNSITSLVQDQEGFIWIGTQDGLARYDGYEFRIFRHNQKDPNSLSHNFIWDINLDSHGNLWITTLGNGLTHLNPRTEQFTQYLFDESDDTGLSHWNTFSSLLMGTEIWVGTNESLDCINLDSKLRETFYPGHAFGQDSTTILIRTLACLPDSQNIWMNTKDGLASINRSKKTFTFYPESPFGTQTDLRNIYDLKPDGKNLVVTTDNKVIQINFKNQTEKILLDVDSVKTDRKIILHGFCRLKNGKSLIFSNNGIFFLSKNSRNISRLTYDSANPETLAHSNVIDVLESEDGVLWVGTRNGLSVVRLKTGSFLRYGKSDDAEKSISASSTKAFVIEPNENYLVGTSEGIAHINQENGNVKNLNSFLDRPIPSTSKYILSMLKDGEGIVWAGALNGGLARIEKKESNAYSLQLFPLGNASIQTILDEDSLLWLGSSGNGLLKFSKTKGLLKSYPHTGKTDGPSHTYVYAILKDRYENMWLGTPTGGLNLFNRETEEFFTIRNSRTWPNGLSGNTILSLLEDSKGKLWVGTTTGLSCLQSGLKPDMYSYVESNPDSVTFTHFGRENGFPNEVIYGMLEDDHGDLWISTNDGLVHFDTAQGEAIGVYKKEDGCQSNEYNQNAFFKFDDGRMMFGGVSGFQIFHPDSLTKHPYKPKPVITAISINERPLLVSSSDTSQARSIDQAYHSVKELNLTYKENVIGLSFSGLSYTNTHRNKYAYRLKGFDDEWHVRENNRTVTFTNLDPGDYVFEVKAANCDGVWNPNPTALKITVENPPWLSWPAYLAYVTVLGLILYGFIKWRTQRARRDEQLKARMMAVRAEEREAFRKKSARDFHDEAGNKITRINLLVELAGKEAEANQLLKNYLSKISHNTTELSAGMRDFNWALDPEKDSLYDLLYRIKNFGQSLYEGEARSFDADIFSEDLQSVKLSMRLRRDILMIMKEAINNAAKHSGSYEAKLSVSQMDDKVTIRLCDYGCGMSEAKEGAGYGLKNMRSRADKHNIEFKIDSDKEKGVCISITLNLTHMGHKSLG